MNATELKVWKTIKIGVFVKGTRYQYEKYYLGYGLTYEFGSSNEITSRMLEGSSMSPEEKELDLANFSVEELGFSKSILRSLLFNRLLEVGLQLCPAEVGPQLRRQYPEQPRGENILIAMEGIGSEIKGFNVFTLTNWGPTMGLQLEHSCGMVNPTTRVVAIIPRKQ